MIGTCNSSTKYQYLWIVEKILGSGYWKRKASLLCEVVIERLEEKFNARIKSFGKLFGDYGCQVK